MPAFVQLKISCRVAYHFAAYACGRRQVPSDLWMGLNIIPPIAPSVDRPQNGESLKLSTHFPCALINIFIRDAAAPA